MGTSTSAAAGAGAGDEGADSSPSDWRVLAWGDVLRWCKGGERGEILKGGREVQEKQHTILAEGVDSEVDVSDDPQRVEWW